MAYLRGANYVWSDGQRVHFWCADGDDGWEESGWAEGAMAESDARSAREMSGPGGVAVSHRVADVFVMLRLAELLEEGQAVAMIETALEAAGGNFGAVALAEYASRLREIFVQLTPLEPRRRIAFDIDAADGS